MNTKTKQKVPCRVDGCQHEPFKSKQAEATHYHRAHSGRIMTPGQHTVRFKISENLTNGVDQKSRLTKTGKPDKRYGSWRNSNPREAKPIGFMPGTGVKRHKHYKRKVEVIHTQAGCVVQGDGFHLTLSSKFLPAIFHTVAMMISGKEK